MTGSNTVVRRVAGLALRPLAPIALGPHTTGAYGSGLAFDTNATSAVHAKLRIDVHELAKAAKVSFTPNCTLADQVVTCDDTLDPIFSSEAVPQHTNISFSALPGSDPGTPATCPPPAPSS